MIEKTRGVVLHQIKYSDSGIVVQFYTRKFGRISLLVKGVRNKKAGRYSGFLQPLFILDLVIYYKESRGMQSLREFSPAYVPSDMHSDIRKTCMSVFLGEVLTSVIREESPNEQLFDYIERSIIYFDGSYGKYYNFHIAFLANLSRYLGFEPLPAAGKSDIYFDMLNGIYVPTPPLHGNYATPELSGILSAFFTSSPENSDKISLTGTLRNEILENLLRFYSIHLPGLRNIKSLEVLKEVFS